MLQLLFRLLVILVGGALSVGGVYFAFICSLHVIDGELSWILGFLAGMVGFIVGIALIKTST